MKILNFKKSDSPLVIRAKSATSAEIVLYGPIGQADWFSPDAISAKMFSDELKKMDASVNEISLRINSPGGDVFEGITIYNRLKQHKAKVTVYIDGLAASIASVIALAGDEIKMGEGALFMVHLPWTWGVGNRMDLENTVNRLMDVEEQMVSIYSKKSGLSRTEVKSLLEAETWMDSAQAIENGFVDSKVEESVPIAASVMNSRWFGKKPDKYFSETQALNMAKDELKKKVAARLETKK